MFEVISFSPSIFKKPIIGKKFFVKSAKDSASINYIKNQRTKLVNVMHFATLLLNGKPTSVDSSVFFEYYMHHGTGTLTYLQIQHMHDISTHVAAP